MRELFLNECRRFKNAALIFAVVHLLLQLYLNRIGEVLQWNREAHVLALLVYLLSAFAFGLIQFGSYRQPGRWIWLLHRPLSPRAIFGALGMASAALILFAVGLPALLAVAALDAFSARTVDLRHYLLVLQLVCMCAMAWLAGSYVMLSPKRTAIAILLLPIVLLGRLASGPLMMLPIALCLIALTVIALGRFKPNRGAPPTGWGLALGALPLQLGFYFALAWGGSLLFQNVQIVCGVHPLNRPLAPAGGFIELTRAEGRDLLLQGLASSTDARAVQWRRQVAQLPIPNIEPSGLQRPVRHQVSNLNDLRWTDKKNHIEWTFSHDAMRFHGRDIFTSQERGWLGLNGLGDSARFPTVPEPHADYITTAQRLLRYDPQSGRLATLIELQAPETLTATTPYSIRHGGEGLLYVITNLRLLAYAEPAPDSPPGQLQLRYSVALPGPLSELYRIDLAGLDEGKMVSFSFGRNMLDGAPDAAQVIMLAHADGPVEPIARRALTHDFPPLFEHREWWVSPLMYAALALPPVLFEDGRLLDRGENRFLHPLLYPRPSQVWAAALATALASALAACWWLGRCQASRRHKLAWAAACMLLGAPALLSLMALQGRAPQALAPPRNALALN
ncbi:MAG: hypothetical protein V4508_12675 [Pseudomonadota bacterium]